MVRGWLLINVQVNKHFLSTSYTSNTILGNSKNIKTIMEKCDIEQTCKEINAMQSQNKVW